MLTRKPTQRIAEEIRRNIDRHISRRCQRAEQARGLFTVAGTQVDQRGAAAHAHRDLGRMQAEDGGFGARRVVLRQVGNRFEQTRAEGIVEKLRADTGRGCEQACLRLGTQRGVVFRKELVEGQARPNGVDRWLRLNQTGQRAAGIGIGGRLGGLHGVSRCGWNGTVLHGHEGHRQRETCHRAYAITARRWRADEIAA